MVRQALGGRAAQCRHLGGVRALDPAGLGGDDHHGGAVAAGRPCLSQALLGGERAVLHRRRQPDYAVHRCVARHRLEFRIIDDIVKAYAPEFISGGFETAMGLFTSGIGAHLTWTLPFGLLIMFAIFNHFDGRFEEAARDLGATPWQTFRHVVLPIIGPSVVGIALDCFKFMLLNGERRAIKIP